MLNNLYFKVTKINSKTMKRSFTRYLKSPPFVTLWIISVCNTALFMQYSFLCDSNIYLTNFDVSSKLFSDVFCAFFIYHRNSILIYIAIFWFYPTDFISHPKWMSTHKSFTFPKKSRIVQISVHSSSNSLFIAVK